MMWICPICHKKISVRSKKVLADSVRHMDRKHPEVYVKINEEGKSGSYKVEWILDDSQKDHDHVYSVKSLADAFRERENVEKEGKERDRNNWPKIN